MTRTLLAFDYELLDVAKQVALAAGYRDVVRLLADRRVPDGLELSDAEAAHLAKFVVVLRLQAELHYPHWDGGRTGYDAADAALFDQVNSGLHEKLASALLDDFPAVWEAANPPG